MSKKDAIRAVVGASNKNIKEEGSSPALIPQGVVGRVPTPYAGGISARIDKGERTLEFFRRGDCGRLIGELGQQLVFDLKTLLTDTRAVVELVNEDDVMHDLLHHSFHLLRATITGKGYGPHMPAPVLVENWRLIVGSLFTSADILDMFSAGGTLVHTLHETDEFLVRLSEVANLMMELLLSVPSQQEGGFLSREEEHKWVGLRARTMEDLRVTWMILSKNRVWRSLHNKRRTSEPPRDGRNLFNVWLHICELLQRVLGDKINVDDALEASFSFLESIGQNTQLLVLIWATGLDCTYIYELKDTLARLTYDLPRMTPPDVENQLFHFVVTIQRIKDEIKSDPTYERAYQECLKLFDALKSEPTTARLIKDSKKMWKHLRSRNPNEYIDPSVLNSMRHMILPILLEHLNTIRFPQIKSSSDFLGKVEYTLDNLHVDITSIMPSNIHIRFECSMEHGATRYQAERTFIYIEVRKIHVHLHDVRWHYARLAFPRFTDAGKVDINSTGEGMILRMKLELKEGLTHRRVLEPLAVRCYMDSIQLQFSDSKHNRLYNVLTGLLSTRVKREMQKNFELKMLQMCSDVNEFVASLVAHLKARPTSPMLRRASVSRRASISRRPSVSTSYTSLPPTPQLGYVPPSTPVYQPPLRNLEPPSILKIPLPARRGTPTPPTPPLRSTYPTIYNCPPSPPLCVSPVQALSSEPVQRVRPISLPAPLSLPPLVTSPQVDLSSQKVRFLEAQQSCGYESDNDSAKPLVSILKKKNSISHATFSSPFASPMKKNSISSQTTFTSPIQDIPSPRANGPFADMDYAVCKYLQTNSTQGSAQV